MIDVRTIELKRTCGVRGCNNGPHNGKRVFAVARTSEPGPRMAIMCEDCIAEAYRQVFPATETDNAEPATETDNAEQSVAAEEAEQATAAKTAKTRNKS